MVNNNNSNVVNNNDMAGSSSDNTNYTYIDNYGNVMQKTSGGAICVNSTLHDEIIDKTKMNVWHRFFTRAIFKFCMWYGDRKRQS